jgi:microcompartment protein CcmL/EutN
MAPPKAMIKGDVSEINAGIDRGLQQEMQTIYVDQ